MQRTTFALALVIALTGLCTLSSDAGGDPLSPDGGVTEPVPTPAPPPSPILGCGPINCAPSPNSVECFWNVTHSDMCDDSPSGDCNCIDNLCDGPNRDKSVAEDPLLSTSGDRPEGDCFSISCGTCYEWGLRPCKEIHVCANDEFGFPCEFAGHSGCAYRPLMTVDQAGWYSTGQDCCVDAE